MSAISCLGDVAEVFNGKTPSKAEQRAKGHPVLKIKDVDESGKFRGMFNSFVDAAFSSKYESKTIKSGDTLILNAAHNADYVGSKHFFATEDVEGALATGEWLIVRPDSKTVDARYINYWLRSAGVRFRVKSLVKGIHLYPRDVAKLKVSFPPLLEQKRLANILDKAEEVRYKRQRVTTLSEEFLRSTFVDLFGDPILNPKGWPEEKLGDLVSFTTGKLDSNAATADGPYPFFTCAREVFCTNEYAFDCEAILLAGNNAVGNYWVKFYAGKFNAYQRTYVITRQRKNLSYSYLRLALEASLAKMKHLSRGTNTKYLTLTILKDFKIQIPPSEFMEKFSSIELSVERVGERFSSSAEQIDELICSLNGGVFVP